MSNTNNHQSHQRAFTQQSYTTIVQQFPTSGIVHSDTRTNGLLPARQTRMSPLDVEVAFDISRLPARLPASPAERRLDVGSTHTRPSEPNGERHSHHHQVVTLVQFDSIRKRSPRPHVSRPDTGTNQQTFVQAPGRGVRIDPDSAHSPQKLVERPNGGVRQDKDRNSCDRAASLQPAAVNKFTRSQATSRFSARSQKGSSDNRRCVPVQVWVSPLVKEHLARIAALEGLSLSAAGGALLERALQRHVDMQYGALLSPVIEKSITRQMRGIATRLSWLLVRVAFDAGQTRSLVTNILGRQPGVTETVLKTLLESSGRSAKGNIMRRTPQIASLIEVVEQWMVEDDGGEKKQYD